MNRFLDLEVHRYPMGEEKMSLYSSKFLSTCFCYEERLCVEAMDVEETFFLL
jgi:hypothetical protein